MGKIHSKCYLLENESTPFVFSLIDCNKRSAKKLHKGLAVGFFYRSDPVKEHIRSYLSRFSLTSVITKRPNAHSVSKDSASRSEKRLTHKRQKSSVTLQSNVNNFSNEYSLVLNAGPMGKEEGALRKNFDTSDKSDEKHDQDL
ncbi:hypothetical protein TNCV_1990211 [Trichonephila clavipes]|nr:hypothetical protein TNCV_1990211 [Trichonephila clavipes]